MLPTFVALSLRRALGLFRRKVNKKHKLYKILNIRKLGYINIEKKLKYIKFYNCFLWCFIFWNCCMIISLSILQNTSLSMYTVKQSFINWSPTWLILFQIYKDLNEFFLRFKTNKFLLLLLGLLIFFLDFISNWFVIGFLFLFSFFFFLYLKRPRYC